MALIAQSQQETGEAFLGLVTIAHPLIDPPIRATSDGVATVSRGEIFTPYPFDVTFPSEKADELARARLAIDNVDREIGIAIREAAASGEPPTVTVELVMAHPRVVSWGRVTDAPTSVVSWGRVTDTPTEYISWGGLGGPDVVEWGPFVNALRQVKLDDLTVSGDLLFDDILDESVPAIEMTPNVTPGLHR